MVGLNKRIWTDNEHEHEWHWVSLYSMKDERENIILLKKILQ